MLIKADPTSKTITVNVSLTTTSGKTRVKQRNAVFDYGLPFASRTNPFNQKNYIEWQIGYDAIVPSNTISFKEEKFKNFCNTTLKEHYFIGDNGKKKTLYELSEYLYYFAKWKVIPKKDLQKLLTFLQKIDENNLLDKHKHCQIKRTHPITQTINTIDFNALIVEYPQLIYEFGKYEIIAEVTIKEKQRAVGTQPMLYFCFPITELHANPSLLGRCANVKEFAEFKFDQNNAFIVVEMIKIFGMLSVAHQHDIVQIIQTILRDL
ncbi:hypothetical protein [uncultured Gammaproteobacteria bacterium]|jgi:hypothetical protein|nr:hypothetical protein [uncultured Gammaproteobacteria bacterium]CAC9566534.1 hypothetical protein [uncultured Gammaproteobacteria bacterium]CAC9566719.1 hypothetical protein [uncultured Gammaproteobacteria bacterium]CAC9585842.1 hypothetical protein [uncultured Gammaproteobacteria bacterium]